MHNLLEMLKAAYGKDLPSPYRELIETSLYQTYNGKTSPALPGWSERMRYPLCFDPEVVVEIFENKHIWNSGDDFQRFIPIACFFRIDNPNQLSDMIDFIALETHQPHAVYLWDHEGEFRLVSDSLRAFLDLL